MGLAIGTGLRRKLGKAFRQRGFCGTVGLVRRYITQQIYRKFSPAFTRQRQSDLDFDRKYNVSTADGVALSDLDIKNPNWMLGANYEPTSFQDFQRLFDALKIKHQDFLFLDFGSGKGRTMLLASDFPFRKIVGIEFSAELHAVCMQNIATYNNPAQQCFALESVCADATQFEFPDEPTVVYMYNPFSGEVLASVLKNLVSSLKSRPRLLYIAYSCPTHASLIDALDEFERVAAGPGFVIWNTRFNARVEES